MGKVGRHQPGALQTLQVGQTSTRPNKGAIAPRAHRGGSRPVLLAGRRSHEPLLPQVVRVLHAVAAAGSGAGRGIQGCGQACEAP